MSSEINFQKKIDTNFLVLQILTVTAVIATAFVLLSKKMRRSKKIKEALAYEIW